MSRWVLAEWANGRSKAHILRSDRTVWSLCWRNLGNSVTADLGRAKCRACLAAEAKAKGGGK